VAARETEAHVEEFLKSLERLSWFSQLGRWDAQEPADNRLRDWGEWPGPLHPAVDELHRRQQALYHGLLEGAGEERAKLLALWDRIQAVVMRAAGAGVPFDPQQDCYHAPTMAVWQAAWTAGLVGWCMTLGREMPDDLAQQWRWFAEGHWPSGYAWERGGEVGPLVVY
jgi:hypothetical protein